VFYWLWIYYTLALMRKLLFSVTAKDCRWSYTRGTGNGGQKRNKTNSAVHCIHPPSGAHGYAEDERSQLQNRQLAFERMAKSKAFQAWNKAEVRRITGQQAEIEAKVERELRKVRVEVKNAEGRWTQIDKDTTLPDEA